jgi:DNA-binding protein HU-beta
MNTRELVDQLAAEQGLTRAAAKHAIETVMTAIINAATQGDEIALSGFGKFKVTSRSAREGRNPATGARIKIAASKKAIVHPSEGRKGGAKPRS